jgi:hypothetical protein
VAKRKRAFAVVEFPLRPGERSAGVFGVDDTVHRAVLAAPGAWLRQWTGELPRQLRTIEIDAHLGYDLSSETTRAIIEGANECSLLLQRVRGWLSRKSIEGDEIAAAMGDAALLQNVFSAMAVNELEKLIKAGLGSIKGGKHHAVKLHAGRTARTTERWSKIETYVRSMAANGHTREETIKSTMKKFIVKRSTLLHKSNVRAVLPPARRKRSP